ncbi:thiol reductant ABC exporter subunit CydD [Streptomyces sp. NPDC056190]|uniref:thiol reductant ABC exporter subunit CydD n=1 Tax=Streptomyces sp. NPDC056190 TaxID=3345741 RepID=UPI0035D68AB7
MTTAAGTRTGLSRGSSSPASPGEPTDRAVRAWLLAAVPGVRRAAVWTAAATALGAAAVVGQGLALAAALTHAFRGTAPTTAALWCAVAVAVRALTGLVRSRVAQRAAAEAKLRLRTELLDATARTGPYAQRRAAGETAILLTRGLDALDPYLAGYLPQVAVAALVPPTVVIAVLVHDPLSGIVLLVTLPLIPVFGALVGLHTRDATAHQWDVLARLGGHFLDALRGLGTLRVFGRATVQEEIVGQAADRHRRATLRTLRIAFLSTLVLDTAATLSVALIAVPVGLRLLGGSLDLHTALVVLLLVPEAFLPLRALGSCFHAGAEGMTAARSAHDVLAEAPASASSTAVTDVPAPRRIRLDHVTVTLPGRAEPVLRDVSLTLHAGERVALTGPSGAGKSTLLALLLGMLTPTSGRVLIDGRDLAELDADAWRRHLAWVPQRPHLFDRTVADNIRLGRPEACDADVTRAARAAGAHAFVASLPRGYATRLGARGAGLSTGQRQRIALARAFLRDAPVLLLDEPTSGLDADSESALLGASARLMTDRTVLLVAHRPALLRDVDRHLEVSAGTVRERNLAP